MARMLPRKAGEVDLTALLSRAFPAGNSVPSAKGLMMTLEQFRMLVAHVPKIEEQCIEADAAAWHAAAPPEQKDEGEAGAPSSSAAAGAGAGEEEEGGAGGERPAKRQKKEEGQEGEEEGDDQ